jgi:hypothetical protein
MATTTQVEVWVMVDQDGDYDVGTSEELARENYDGNIGGDAARRLVKLLLTVPLPEPLVVTGVIPAPVEPQCELQVE